jgi:hypothetical protein
VRTDNEAFGFVGRGFDVEIQAYGKSKSSDICPTGALYDKIRGKLK